jgi:hypothetical protein
LRSESLPSDLAARSGCRKAAGAAAKADLSSTEALISYLKLEIENIAMLLAERAARLEAEAEAANVEGCAHRFRALRVAAFQIPW